MNKPLWSVCSHVTRFSLLFISVRCYFVLGTKFWAKWVYCLFCQKTDRTWIILSDTIEGRQEFRQRAKFHYLWTKLYTDPHLQRANAQTSSGTFTGWLGISNDGIFELNTQTLIMSGWLPVSETRCGRCQHCTLIKPSHSDAEIQPETPIQLICTTFCMNLILQVCKLFSYFLLVDRKKYV